MEQQYITCELHQIPKGNLSKGVAGLIAQTIMDYGKSIDEATQSHIIKRVYGMLNSGKYKHWQWREVITAFERGKIGQYGGESRCSVAGIERWLHGYGNERMKRIVEQSIKEKEEMSNCTKTMANGSHYAHALQWHMGSGSDVRKGMNRLRDTYGVSVIETIVRCLDMGRSLKEVEKLAEKPDEFRKFDFVVMKSDERRVG